VTGALHGLTVLDLSRTQAGAMASMLLADQGAAVTKLEPPDGDPVRAESGSQVWLRNKRSAIVALPGEADLVLDLAARADVYLDSWTPVRASAFGLPDDRLAGANSRLVRCSITAYGSDTRHSGRPDDPTLVAARSGLMWEQKGWVGGPIARLSGAGAMLPDLTVPDGCWDGDARTGPIYPATPQPALAAAYLGALAILAALHARVRTGRGQRVETSMLQGVLASTWGAWQRAEKPDAPDYDSWVFDSRANRGHFECADRRWVCCWVPRPSFVLGVSEGARLDPDVELPSIYEDGARILPHPNDLALLHHYFPSMTEAFRRFTADEWTEAAAAKDIALQPVRSPEEALADPALTADGSVISVLDGRLGEVRQAGRAICLHVCDPGPLTGPPTVGEHDRQVRFERTVRPSRQPGVSSSTSAPSAPPLDGLLVVDLGLAVAGPWGTQLLSDLGAVVIKVNRRSDWYWHSSHMAMACNRGKQSLAVDLKTPDGFEVFRRLVTKADVVHHNMRASAATRLGVGYEQLRAVNPALIYCHTTGFDESRAHLPGNDQTGAALTGVLHNDGGCKRGGRPAWSLTSLGDIGNGFLSAIGVLMALLHRNRTGQGQLVNTSIVRAHLLGASSAWLHPDGTPTERDHLDAEQLGFDALRRIYRAGSGWICISCRGEEDWDRLCGAIGRRDLRGDPRFSDPCTRAANDGPLSDELSALFSARPATEWFAVLDRAGVSAEICDPDVAVGVFDDPDLLSRKWVTTYDQPLVGRLSQFGLLFDFSDTPARIAGPPLVVGDSSLSVLALLGYSEAEMERLIAQKAVSTPRPGR
jgi:crotonobetainyl-CoA:carnitine CoA-transferase CaiB-like acyl-CoA transferase